MNMKGKALLAGCIALIMSGAAMAEDIKVAVVGAMSGPVAQYGDQEFTGAEQAIADINAKGGIKGNKLQMVKYDDACDPKQAVAVANKVINDGIKYVIGHLCSSSTQPASDIYEDEGVLMITPAATAPELTARGYHLILRTTGLDSDQGPTAAKYILESVKPQRIAIVHDKQQYGEGLARAVQDNLKKGGANVVFFDGITAGEKDFSTLVARLKKENIDFVYYGGYHPEMGQILRQSRAAGLKTQFMVWTTYAALQSLEAGLNQSDDPAEIAKYLKGATVETVMGPLSWNEKGDLKGFEFGVFTWHANGTATDAK
ncbi:MAG: ABC transporter substrate-binding protein [Klebsiella oxytoca]|nr:ABC transporter substrate-binding protein [Klebsiella oxytoca]